MRRGLTTRGDRTGARPGGGFTLIELLVVIAIISMLVGILVPVVSMAIQKAEDARCRARVQELADGCESFYIENNEYYPGQQHPQLLGATLTGSQVLAMSLFTDEAVNPTYPQPRHAQVKPEEDLVEIDGKGQTISDRTSRPMAILYYPARLGQSGTEQTNYQGANVWAFKEYKYADNEAYTGRTSAQFEAFTRFIRDGRFDKTPADVSDDKPRAPGRFLIVAAGLDRRYFTSDDVTYPEWQE